MSTNSKPCFAFAAPTIAFHPQKWPHAQYTLYGHQDGLNKEFQQSLAVIEPTKDVIHLLYVIIDSSDMLMGFRTFETCFL